MHHNRRLRDVALPLIAIIAAIAVALHFRVNQRADRIPELKKLVAEQEEESAQAIAEYQPTTKTGSTTSPPPPLTCCVNYRAWSGSKSRSGPTSRHTVSSTCGTGTSSPRTYSPSMSRV